MSESTWTWVLFAVGFIGVAGSFVVGNKKWYGHLIVALHSYPFLVYSIVFDKPGFIATFFMGQFIHLRNMLKWKKNSAK
jgi:hypothetical protein